MRIGLLGPANAGKDTVADMLCEAIPGLRKVSFADALYEEVSQAFGVRVDKLRDRRTKEEPTPGLGLLTCRESGFHPLLEDARAYSPREILELWGTQYRRAQQEDYWVRQALQVQPPVIHPDVRFPDELAICTHAFVIRRPGGEILRNHESDQLWRSVSGLPVVENDGDLAALREKVQRLARETRK